MFTWIPLSVAILIIYLVWEKFRQWRLEGNIPGPPTVPFFGNALMFLGFGVKDLMCEMLHCQKYKYSNLYRLWLGHKLVVCVADPKTLEIISKSNENHNHSEHYDFFLDLLQGVFISKDERWRDLRKIVNTVFHNSKLDHQLKVFNDCSKVLCQVLEHKFDKGTFNIDHFIHRCLLDIVCKIFASSRTDFQLKEGVTYPEDVRLATQLTLYRPSKIWLHSDFIYNLTAKGRVKKAAVKNILDFGIQIIEERREDILNETAVSNSDDLHSKLFLDQMMDYAKAKQFTDLELSMSITDVLIAGSDTTSVALSYMIMMLAMHEDIQEKVYEELYGIFGDSNRPVELRDMNQMLLLERVIKEVLRHCCPPHIARKVDKSIKLESTTIPAGSILYIMLYKLHRDPVYWSHPDSFYPDHFLPENIERRPKNTFLPFFSGIRACPGQRFSQMIMKIIMTTLLRKYKITTSIQPTEVNFSLSLMIEISNGYNVQLTLR